jgi:hypothetical protein
MSAQLTRELIASVMVSLDGFTAGPGGDQDVMWFVGHAAPEQMTPTSRACTAARPRP